MSSLPILKEDNPQIAIVGIFFDGYYDLWEDFLDLFSRRWPDCPYPHYIVNNSKKLDGDKYNDWIVLNAGDDAEYSKKVQLAVQSIKADYFVLVLEDFFIEKPIKNRVMDKYIRMMKENQLKYIRMPMPEFMEKKDKKCFDKETGFYFIPKNSEYTVSCQPSIWEKSFLSKCIGNGNYNAWIFEGMYSYSSKAHSRSFLRKCRIDFSNPLNLRHGALQGKILPSTFDDFVNNGYSFHTKREKLSIQYEKKALQKKKIKEMIPFGIQRGIKKIFKKKTIFWKYEDKILEELKNNNML